MEQSTSSMILGPVFVLRVFWSVLQRHCRSSAHLWAPESLGVCHRHFLCLAARPDGSAAPGGHRLIENSLVTVWRKFVWWRIVHLCVSVCVCSSPSSSVSPARTVSPASLSPAPPSALPSPPPLSSSPVLAPSVAAAPPSGLRSLAGGGDGRRNYSYDLLDLKSILPLLSPPAPPPLTCCSSCLSLLLSLSSIWAGSSRAVMVLRWLDEKHKRTTQNIY